LLDNPREIAAAVFHEYIEDPSISVDKAIVVSHDVLVVNVFEYVAEKTVQDFVDANG
jgi:hypothetical protein